MHHLLQLQESNQDLVVIEIPGFVLIQALPSSVKEALRTMAEWALIIEGMKYQADETPELTLMSEGLRVMMEWVLIIENMKYQADKTLDLMLM